HAQRRIHQCHGRRECSCVLLRPQRRRLDPAVAAVSCTPSGQVFLLLPQLAFLLPIKARVGAALATPIVEV
ncbi:hypothetical protein PENTCL1PPCAC_13472, partial [Pristionchus entomophagus]